MMTPLMEQRIRQGQAIRNALELAGWKLRDVDRAYGLPYGAVSRALTEPNEAAERAIAAVLGRDPAELWAERYDETGQRLSPQPFANYERLPPVRQRRKRAVELTGWR